MSAPLLVMIFMMRIRSDSMLNADQLITFWREQL
jgi:hypothetical protein